MHCVLIPELGFLQEKTEQIIEVNLPLWEKKKKEFTAEETLQKSSA